MGGKAKSKSDELKKRLTRYPTKQIPFARIFSDQFHCDEFLALSRSARLLYVDFLLASGGTTDFFTFPRRDHKHIPPQSFVRAKNELIQGGFLKEKTYYKQESEYQISSDWMRTDPIRQRKPRRGGRSNLKKKT